MPRRNSPFLFLNLPLLIIIIPTIAILLLFFAVPSLLSVNSHKIRPNTVKKGWDSLNVFLVLFAILCGVLGKRNDDESSNNEDDSNTHNVVGRKAEQHSAASSNWFDDQFHDQKIQSNRLKRSSSSYPDLRQESLWESPDDRFRFFDDFEISKLRWPTSSSEYFHPRGQQTSMEESSVKEIPVDTFVLRRSVPSPPPKSPAPPPPAPPPPPPPIDHVQSQRRAYKAVSDSSKEKVESEDGSEFNETKYPPPTPPPPPLPPPPASTQSDHKYRKSERKKGNATKEIRMVLASIYNQRKRKKKQKTRNLYDDTLHLPSKRPSFSTPPPPPSPPPPPPPPPPSVFHNLFKKGSKSKRIHSFKPSTSPPPPPPPPPPPSLSSSRRSSRSKIQAVPPPPPAPPTLPRKTFGPRNSASTGRPPLPKRIDNFYDENVNRGGQSPLIPMPPPPPPPFRVPGFRFVVNGDFVKIRSTHSSRCSSPELEEMDRESKETVNVTDRRDGIGGSVFGLSPDVNVEADTFIARLRGEWRLEKINSMKEKSMGHGPG